MERRNRNVGLKKSKLRITEVKRCRMSEKLGDVRPEKDDVVVV